MEVKYEINYKIVISHEILFYFSVKKLRSSLLFRIKRRKGKRKGNKQDKEHASKKTEINKTKI